MAAYVAGMTMKDLAAEFGIERRSVSAHLRRAQCRSVEEDSTPDKPPK